MLDRRAFLQGVSGATLASLLGARAGFATVPGDNRFVFLFLRGGLDGLHALAPFADPLYRALRPRLAVAGVEAEDAAPTGAAPRELPPGFDAAEFERVARAIFIRMQTAYDAGDLDDLRQFTMPEVFAELRLQLQERGDAAQHTDVAEVRAEVIEVAEDDGRQIVSVRYHGRAAEEAGAPAEPFDEVWHLARPLDGSRAWAIAGVQQRAQA